MKLRGTFLILMALSFALVACVSEVDRTVAPTITPEPSATFTPLPEPTTAPSPTPAPTQTPLPTPTNTPTPTPTQVPTPLPTSVPGPLPERINDAPPHVFVGSVTIGNFAAPDGTEVTVWVAEFTGPVGTAVTNGGNYTVLAHQHGTTTFEGKTLRFKVNGQDSGETGIWERGAATILALSLN